MDATDRPGGVGTARPHAPTPPRPTLLVVNGDDFGYSDTTNSAIVRCHDEGVQRSTSLLANCPASRAALALARSRPTLGVGLHVNLTEGAPVLPPAEVPSLVDQRGRFRSLLPQLSGLVAGRTNLDEVEREIRAQFAILLDADIRPTHVDGHLHAHAFPGVIDVVVRLMGEFGVRAMRSPLLGAWLPAGATPDATKRRRPVPRSYSALRLPDPAIRAMTGPTALRAALRVYPDGPHGALVDAAGIARAGQLFDASRFLAAADPALALAEAVAAVPGGLVETMTHPAWNRDAARGAAEVALITDPRLPEMLAARGIRVAHYGEV